MAKLKFFTKILKELRIKIITAVYSLNKIQIE